MKHFPAFAVLLLLFYTPAQAAAHGTPENSLADPLSRGGLWVPQPQTGSLLNKSDWIYLADDDDDEGRKKKQHKARKHRDDDDDDDDDNHKGKKHKKKKWKNKDRGKHAKWKPYHNKRLPGWAQDCGLPPGLAKQNKIPPGWEKKCKDGYKYYEHEEEFRKDIPPEYSKSDPKSPDYKTVYALDDSACKVAALKEAGSIAEGIAKGAVYGGLLGAATGAVVEAVQDDGNPEHGAIYGAVGGAAGGATLGGIVASNEYKSTYRRCMQKRGHRVD